MSYEFDPDEKSLKLFEYYKGKSLVKAVQDKHTERFD